MTKNWIYDILQRREGRPNFQTKFCKLNNVLIDDWIIIKC